MTNNVFKFSLMFGLIFTLFGLQSCAVFKKLYRNDNPDVYGMFGSPLYKHHCPLVRYPARSGFYVGETVAIPFIVIGVGLAELTLTQMGEAGVVFLIPAGIITDTTGCAFGAPGWVLFGWWWPEEKANPKGSESKGEPNQNGSIRPVNPPGSL